MTYPFNVLRLLLLHRHLKCQCGDWITYAPSKLATSTLSQLARKSGTDSPALNYAFMICSIVYQRDRPQRLPVFPIPLVTWIIPHNAACTNTIMLSADTRQCLTRRTPIGSEEVEEGEEKGKKGEGGGG